MVKDLQRWKEAREAELIGKFTLANRKYLNGLGQIVDGAKVQGLCNSTFGGQIGQCVVSKYGVALVISRHSLPVYVLGVSLKDFSYRDSLTLYRLIYNNYSYDYQTKHFEIDGNDWDNLLATLDDEFSRLEKTTRTLNIAQPAMGNSCTLNTIVILLIIGSISYLTINALYG